ncbi:MAG: hypothetical protein R2705_19370 [Ilumatobacteraceae bacterium]
MTVQAEILSLLRRLQSELGMAIVLVTHDLGVIAEMCDDVVVMYAGQVVERRRQVDLRTPDAPVHPGPLAAMPSPEHKGETCRPSMVESAPRSDAERLPLRTRCGSSRAQCESPVASRRSPTGGSCGA